MFEVVAEKHSAGSKLFHLHHHSLYVVIGSWKENGTMGIHLQSATSFSEATNSYTVNLESMFFKRYTNDGQA